MKDYSFNIRSLYTDKKVIIMIYVKTPNDVL